MRKTDIALAFSISAAVLSGCTSLKQQALDTESVDVIKRQGFALTTRKKPDFSAMTAGKAAFGLLGAAAMISEGNKIVANNNVPDPAEVIATNLAKAMADAYGAQPVKPAVTVDSDDAAQVAAKADGLAGLVLDVQTVGWSFAYFPTDWTHYRVNYVGRARLIDVKTKKVVAAGSCSRHLPDQDAKAPTYDELLGNGAERLKADLNAIAGECADLMKSQMLR